MSKLIDESRASCIATALGFAALAVTHLIFLYQVPGLHYDESWAALFSHRIANEPGFWPREAMSPYTSAWGHYVAAAAFRLFGTSLFVFRATAEFLVLAGSALLWAALGRFGEKRAAALLPWLLAFSPALIFNERFAIDITTFHVFCFGLLAYGISLFRSHKKSGAVLVTAACLLGLTSHVLFAGTILALLGARLLSGPYESGRGAWSGAETACGLSIAFVSLLFFTRILFAIPEKDKALSLIFGTILAATFVAVPASRKLFVSMKRRSGLRALIWTFSIPGWLLLAIFWEGTYSALFYTGRISATYLIGSTCIAPLFALVVSLQAHRRAEEKTLDIPKPFFDFWVLSLLITTALAVKPTPRYFEVPLILTTVFFALLISRQKLRATFGLWVISGALVFGTNYLSPQLHGSPAWSDYRFLFLHDGTGDTLNKQRLAKDLARAGCQASQVSTTDARLSDELRFLSLGDWPSAKAPCKYGPRVQVERVFGDHFKVSGDF